MLMLWISCSQSTREQQICPAAILALPQQLLWSWDESAPEQLHQLARALAGQQAAACAIAQPRQPLWRLPGHATLRAQHLHMQRPT